MQTILEALKLGDANVLESFVEAEKLWTDILSDIDGLSIEDLAEKLHLAQSSFERACGERHLGKMVMGWSAFPHFYTCESGFEDRGPSAYKLLQAFNSSFCSVEVKHAAREAAEMYGVKDFSGE
jgi:hypothetical protein